MDGKYDINRDAFLELMMTVWEDMIINCSKERSDWMTENLYLVTEWLTILTHSQHIV